MLRICLFFFIDLSELSVFLYRFVAHVSAHFFKAMLQLLLVACEGGHLGPGLPMDGDVAGQPHKGVGDKEAGILFFCSSFFNLSLFSFISGLFTVVQLKRLELGPLGPGLPTDGDEVAGKLFFLIFVFFSIFVYLRFFPPSTIHGRGRLAAVALWWTSFLKQCEVSPVLGYHFLVVEEL